MPALPADLAMLYTNHRVLGKFLGLLEFFPYTNPDSSLR
jgi:hypothetical protein